MPLYGSTFVVTRNLHVFTILVNIDTSFVPIQYQYMIVHHNVLNILGDQKQSLQLPVEKIIKNIEIVYYCT